MTQLQLDNSNGAVEPGSVAKLNGVPKSAVLHRHLRHEFLSVERGEGHHLILEDGRRIFDASGGAAVACVGGCLICIVSVSSEMLFHRDGLALLAFISVHVFWLTYPSMGTLL